MGSSYHITEFNNIEVCSDENCRIHSSLHFPSMAQALLELNKFDFYCMNRDEHVSKYKGPVNYLSGYTEHYEDSRVFREKELERLLGKGKVQIRFKVRRNKSELEIHEILDNGIMNIYSHETNKKITVFTPVPERIISLYHAVGEFPPEKLIKRSERNQMNCYNKIMDDW